VGLKFDHGQGFNQVLADYLYGIWRQRECVSNIQHEMTMSDVALSLLSTSFDMVQSSSQVAPSMVRVAHMQRIKRYIDRHLANPNARHTKIVDIAYQWGFNNPSHFSRVFKAYYQLTPQEYRQQQQSDSLQ
jgi:AraC family transcriptional regulator, positive regulator of tynA and feaB